MRSALTLGVLLLLTAVGAVWGWSALTEPLPKSTEPPVCRDTQVNEGDQVTPELVTVSVFNASDRNGLAGFTMELLVNKGFAEGRSANAPPGTNVDLGEIRVDDTDSPAAALLRTYLGPEVAVVDAPGLGPGVTVIVGEDFERLRRGRPFVVAEHDGTVCMPTSDPG
jgi:hypothetical protein